MSDPRTEAREEAQRRWPSPNSGLYEGLVEGFVLGSEWKRGSLVPVSDAEGRAAYLAFMDMDEETFNKMSPTWRAAGISQGIAAVEAARRVA